MGVGQREILPSHGTGTGEGAKNLNLCLRGRPSCSLSKDSNVTHIQAFINHAEEEEVGGQSF